MWNDARHTLEIGKRSGDFAGMLKERIFNIVWVSLNHGAGIAPSAKLDTVVHYSGKAVRVPGPT
jgi:alpha-D-xyloside xylohydrolase